MTSKDSGQDSFLRLDPLLEHALELEGDARETFLANLPEADQSALRDLLRMSEQLTVSQLADAASQVIQGSVSDSSNATEFESNPGRWRLQRELGSGGMGQVFYAVREAQDSSSQEPDGYLQRAAIKILWSHQAGSSSMARFFRERRILADLDHPGLAKFLDGGLLGDGRPWFAMEYIDGQPLMEYASQQSLSLRLNLFLEVCSAVTHAHQRLVIHRDIKPQNVLVDRQGHARLLDFGVAGVMEDLDDGIHTRTQGTPLTLQYASPEQVTGGLVTVVSDVYQLGLLLYELLVGDSLREFQEVALVDAIEEICASPEIKFLGEDASLPEDLRAIIGCALRSQPDERYSSVAALAEDLARYQQGLPVQAMPRTKSYIVGRFVKRNLPIVTVGSMASVALIAALAFSLYQADIARKQAQRSAASLQILADVFNKADPLGGQGADVSLAQALVAAQPTIEAQLNDDQDLALQVNSTLANIYTNLGLAEQEKTSYEALIKVADDVGSLSAKLSGVAGMGNLLARTDPSEAVRYLEQNLPERPPSSEATEAWLRGQYAFIGALNRLRAFDRVSELAEVLRQVVQERQLDNPRLLAQYHQINAGLLSRQGDTDAALASWRSAVHFSRIAQTPGAVAIALANYGIAVGRAGDLDASQLAFEEAIEIYDAAGHEDDTLASILRSYAGLLFRMDRYADAQKASGRALSMLDDVHHYERFLTGLNLLYYAFISGDIEGGLQTIRDVIQPTVIQFPAESTVPERVRGIFAKLLLFSRQPTLARRTLGDGIEACAGYESFLPVLDQYEAPRELEQRASLWQKLERVGQTAGQDRDVLIGDLTQIALQPQLTYFDVFDRWRLLHGLQGELTPEAQNKLTELELMRTDAEQMLGHEGRDIAADLVAALSPDAVNDEGCGM